MRVVEDAEPHPVPGRFGVRKENLFLVTPDGAVELTEAMRRPLSDRALAAWSS